MYSNHEFIKQSDNDTVRSQRALAQAKRAPLLAPSLHRLIYRSEAPYILKQSSHVLARALCGDLYHFDALLHHCEPKELLDSFGADGTVWSEHLTVEADEEKLILGMLISETSKQLNMDSLEIFVKESYKNITKSIEKGVAPSLSPTGFFSYAILGRLAFELRSDCMAEGAFLYGLWLTTLPYHATTELDVTLEPRSSAKAFDAVLGKSDAPAYLFHIFYYSGAGNTNMAVLEQVHRRSGFYWMRLAKNLALTPFPKLTHLDLTLGVTEDGKQLIPLEYYHRHFLDDGNSQGSQAKTLFPKRDDWWDLDFLFSTELPAEFPTSLKSYQLSVYFKLLMSDPHLSPATRKECLRTIESFSDPRFEWVKSSSLLPLTRWTAEIHRFHKKPFALELHHMFYPLITQSASGGFLRIKEHILRYVREGKIGNIKVHPEESPAYVASLMLLNLEVQAKKGTSAEEQPLIKAQLEPLRRRIDFLMHVEVKHQRNRTLDFKQALGGRVQSFLTVAMVGDITKLQLRDEFRKPGQPIELVNAKKSSLSNTLYSLAFDSNILELIGYAYPGAAEAVLAISAIAKGVTAGSIEDSIKPAIEQLLSIDEETSKTILDSAKCIDANVKWVNKNSKWLECFPYAADLLKFYKQCTIWDKHNGYKLPTSMDGMAYLNEMLNSARPCDSMKIGRRFILAIHHHYLSAIENLSLNSQQLFAEAIAHALLGGLIVRHKLKQTSCVEEGSDELFDILYECISVHGKNILALAPPLLTKDGSTITATEIVRLSGSTLTQKPRYPALEKFGTFKPASVSSPQESTSQQLTNCGSTLDISSP